MKSHNIVFIVLLLCVLGTDCYKILGVFPSASRNVYLTYRGLLRELASRGHDVAVISHFQSADHDAPDNYKDILLSDNHVHKELSYESVIANEILRVPFESLVTAKHGNDGCKVLMNNHNVQYMIQSKAKFDVIIAEAYNSDCALALAANLSAPYIAFNPHPIQPWHYDRLGIHFNSAHVPQANLPFGKNPWYFERLQSFILYYVSNFVYYVSSQVTDHVFLYKYLGDDLPPMESLAANASLVFVNTHQSLFGGTARSDNVIDIGGIHIRDTKPIPTEIDNFINEAEHGVLYINMGPTNDTSLPESKLQELVTTFSKLPYRILWKWNGPKVQNLPRNVLTMRWFPQYDILNHEKVRVFISHAGTLSVIEAVEAGIPMVAIPLFGEQFGNAAALQDTGAAVIVHYKELRHQILLDAINDALDAKVQKNAKLVSTLWRDRLNSPLDTAIYWTEYVARYKGAPNLPETSINKPMYQLYQWDVLAFIGLVLYVLVYIFFAILSSCCGCISPQETKTQVTEGKSSRRVKFE